MLRKEIPFSSEKNLLSAHYQLIIASVSFGLAFYAIFGLVPAYIAKTSTPSQSTVIFGSANVTLGLGSMLGNFIGGWSKTFFDTFLWIYAGIVVIAIISIVMTWLLLYEQISLKNSNMDKSDLENPITIKES